ncbi:MAG: rRNA adenine methyltransferase [Cyanobacteria bacterium SW_4_48_29]|nr:MAG: rRNA adenine methyltransferase [Cyanobacteria bacterium SW_4_48_29]
MIDEGYIKYQCNWVVSDPVSVQDAQELNRWRNQLYRLGLIGEDEDGIGFGNISMRHSVPGQFIVSGTQTGHLSSLSEQHYTRVVDFDLEQNCLSCEGGIKASSESLTHASVYEASSSVNAIIHVHNLELWKRLMYQVPTTSPDCAYGTPEMAKDIIRLFQQENLIEKKILVMSGHEAGIITFGENLDAAGKMLMRYFHFEV